MQYLVGFAPWIVFWTIAGQHGKPHDTLLIASLVALGIAIVAMASQRDRVGVSSLDVGGAIFFAGFAVASLVVDPTWLETYNQFVANMALFTIVLVGSVIGRPFTLTYARHYVPQVMWNETHFVHANVVMTRVWAGAMGLMAASSALLFVVPDDSITNVVFNYMVPFGAFGLTIAWQTQYIAAGQKRGRESAAQELSIPIEAGGTVAAGVDHVTTVVARVDADRIAASLTRDFELMTAWPYRDMGEYTSGGWRLGNINLEVIGLRGDQIDAGWPSRFVTLAPTHLAGLESELNRRGIAHGAPDDQADMDGNPLYRRIPLPGMDGAPGSGVAQLCAFYVPTGTASPVAPPNPAGIHNVTEVKITGTGAEHATDRWRRLLAPTDLATDGTSHPPLGPAIRVESGDADTVAELTLAVDDLDQAAQHFSQAGFSPTQQDSETTLLVGTLPVRLTQTCKAVSSAPLR